MSNGPVIVGLSGYARSGKDTVGGLLIEHYGFQRRAFADALKDIAYRIGWNGEKDEFGRKLLQNLGVAGRDVLGPDVWVEALRRHLPRDGRVVVTDCRFPNEAAWVKDMGGYVVRVVRPGCGPVNSHASETALDGWRFDAVIDNDGSLADLARATARCADHLLGLARVLPFYRPA